ncbi:MAG: LytTR family DNA-binding domain-containing protein [Cyclobacteriaceae bacterium]|jgi:DNA-binding LytR/AlgR family response regulator|nr:LytTR family DNA-binding domain-containing protein [Cytophagales bacterium]MCZ8327304.1 LytTR family DNA-binding domain-containing protein [Cyclobacteriaceae bacterium]
MKLKCLVVDDEAPAIDVLSTYVQATPGLELAGTCKHALEAFAFLQNHKVDIIFLDIQMPQLDGLSFAKTVHQNTSVIFTTAFKDFAFDAFEINALDYLLKPYSFERFLKAIQKIHPLNSEISKDELKDTLPEKFLFFRADRKMVKIPVEDILFIESIKDYVKVISKDKCTITKQTMASLEDMLPKNNFIRIHRSFFVNVQAIESFTNQSVCIGKQELPIGPLYKNELMDRLKEKVRQ